MMRENDLTIVSPVTLEEKLFGPDLASFVAILSSYRGVGARSLNEAIGARLPEVLVDGLRVLGQREIRQLLDNPACLFELQEAIFSEGGDYWNRYTGEDPTFRNDSKEVIHSASNATPDADQWVETGDQIQRRSWLRRHAFEMVAAAVMIMVGFSAASMVNPDSQASTPSAVAFASPESLGRLQPSTWASHVSGGMMQLQISKEELTEEAVSERLAQCVQACSLIYQSEMAFVPEAQRDLLREKCRLWMQRFSDLAVSDEQLSKRAGRLNGVLLDIRDAVAEMNGEEVADV